MTTDTYFTVEYKGSYIHSHYDRADDWWEILEKFKPHGVYRVQMPDFSTHNCKTFIGAKRLITKLSKNQNEVNPAQKCKQCESVFINGVFCHEHGCQNSHLNEYGNMRPTECKWCGNIFIPESKGQNLCSNECAESYY
jgi:hypothetical protein